MLFQRLFCLFFCAFTVSVFVQNFSMFVSSTIFSVRPSFPSVPTGGGRVEVARLLYNNVPNVPTESFRPSSRQRVSCYKIHTVITKLELESWCYLFLLIK